MSENDDDEREIIDENSDQHGIICRNADVGGLN